MKIRSSKITWLNINDAVSEVPGVLHVTDTQSTRKGNGFNMALGSDGTPDQHGNKRNKVAAAQALPSGTKAASYNDWGHVLASLFKIDPDMIAGPYKGAADFHDKTADLFA